MQPLNILLHFQMDVSLKKKSEMKRFPELKTYSHIHCNAAHWT